MKNIIKFFYGLAVIMVLGLAAWNVNISSKTNGVLSDVALANVEALAQESESDKGELYSNQDNTSYCCCPGDKKTCGASACSTISSSICD